jgi:hypothetical protein
LVCHAGAAGVGADVGLEMPDSPRRFPRPGRPKGCSAAMSSGTRADRRWPTSTPAIPRPKHGRPRCSRPTRRDASRSTSRLPELLGRVVHVAVVAPRKFANHSQPWQTAAMTTGRQLGHRARSIPYKARSARANRTAADLAPIIAELRASGITTLNGFAAALNERGVPTPAGSGHWRAAQVSRLLKRLAGKVRWEPNMGSS